MADAIEAEVERWLARFIDQYRESPNLHAVARTYLAELAEARHALDTMLDHFDIETAVGDQLSIIGRGLGFARSQCVAVSSPVFGFPHPDGPQPGEPPIGELGDPNLVWANDSATGYGDLTIEDDETYRRFLQARAVQMRGDFGVDALIQAGSFLFGENVEVIDLAERVVCIVIPRELTREERTLRPLMPRVLPIALGVRPRFHELTPGRELFGFGDGWGGLGELQEFTLGDDDDTLVDASGFALGFAAPAPNAEWLNPQDYQPYG